LPSLLAIIFLIYTSRSLILQGKVAEDTKVYPSPYSKIGKYTRCCLCIDNSCRLYCASPSPRVSPTLVTSLLCTKKSPSWDYISSSPLSSHPFFCSSTTITRVQDAPRLPCCSSGRSTLRPLPPGYALSSQRTSTRTRHWSSSNFSPHLRAYGLECIGSEIGLPQSDKLFKENPELIANIYSIWVTIQYHLSLFYEG